MDGEVIAVHIGHGHYFSFVDLASPVFCALACGVDVDEIDKAIKAISADSPPASVPILLDWINRLVDEDLVVLNDDNSTENQNEEKDQWLSAIRSCKSRNLTFERFTDIEALLALDPVHDISSAGWPSRNG
jgi:TPP-dependent 2-oxoacid decarboxylase